MSEHERIRALKRYEILDTPPEREFDDITHLAAQICETPIALISLVDQERLWFKSTVGLELCEMPRNISFCENATLSEDLFEVFDASKDKRFLANPLVTGEPHIRSYAGAPLVTPDGQNLGTLCVIDQSPRELREEQRDGLKRLAAQVVRQLEVRHDRMQLIRNTEELRESNERTEQIIASALDAVITMGMDGLIVSWNPQAETIFGWSAGEVIGKRMSEVIIPPSLREAHERGLDHLAKTGEARVLDRRLEMTALNKEGKEFPIELTISQVRVSGQPFFSGFIRDLSAVKEAETKLKRTSELLSAVGHLQSGYISRDHAGAAETFDALLQLLLKFTDSEYGFVAEVLRDENGDPYLKTHAITNIAWNDEMRAFYEKHKAAGLEFRNLKTLFGVALITGETVISNDPSTDPRRGGLPPGHPPMNSFLGVPIKQGEEIIGMVGVSNRPGGYDPEIVEEIELLFSTYGTIIRGFQFAKQQQADQQRIEALNLNLEARAADLAEALDMNRRVERERRDALEEYSANLEQRVAERTAELEQSQRQFQDLFEFAPDALVMTDQAGVIQLANLQSERIFGWKREELLGQSAEILLPFLRGEFPGEQLNISEDTENASLSGRRKDDTEFPLEISFSPIQTGDCKLVTVAMRDVSERILLEQEVARISSHEQERLSRELHDHLGAYLAGIAFRCKTMAETLKTRAIPEAEHAQQLVGQINDGINLVRNFARLLSPVDVASGGLAAGLTGLAREMETIFEIDCQVNLSSKLPPLTQEQSMQLYRIAQEAIRNAVQHGKAPHVSLSIQCDADCLTMTIANDGVPWNPEEKPRLGLGLRTMRHRAAGLGGSFTIHAKPDGLTEAICILPYPTETEATPAPPDEKN